MVSRYLGSESGFAWLSVRCKGAPGSQNGSVILYSMAICTKTKTDDSASFDNSGQRLPAPCVFLCSLGISFFSSLLHIELGKTNRRILIARRPSSTELLRKSREGLAWFLLLPHSMSKNGPMFESLTLVWQVFFRPAGFVGGNMLTVVRNYWESSYWDIRYVWWTCRVLFWLHVFVLDKAQITLLSWFMTHFNPSVIGMVLCSRPTDTKVFSSIPISTKFSQMTWVDSIAKTFVQLVYSFS